jgi:uncharacterized membrane protein YfcA
MTGFAVAGAVTGFLVGLTGVGGGALMTPILLLFLGVAPTTAVATDLWFAVVTKVVAAGFHWRSGEVDWQVVRRLWAGSLPAAAVLSVVAVRFGRQGAPVWLTPAIGTLVAITACGIFLAPILRRQSVRRRLSQPVSFKAWQPTLTVVAGVILAGCVALTSVGAGALGSVILMYLYPLRMKPHRLVATDIVHAVPLAMVAGSAYWWGGQVDTTMLTDLLMGSIPAAALGSLVAGRVPARAIQLAMAACLLLAAIRMLM